MSIKDMLTQIRNTLNIYAQEENGGAFVCADIVHLYNQLWTSSQGLRILCLYNGEMIRQVMEGAAILGRVDRNFVVVVSRGRSISAVERGAPLVENNSNARPLYEIVADVRDIIRGLMFDPASTERPVDFVGVTPFPTADTGMVLDAVQIDFKVGCQLPEIVPQPEEIVT